MNIKKIKTIAKYTLNIMNFVNAVLLVLIPIWNIPYGEKLSTTLVGLAGVISAYLLGDKAINKTKEEVIDIPRGDI